MERLKRAHPRSGELAASSAGCFGFQPWKPTLANFNRKGMYWHDARLITELERAEIRVSERAGGRGALGS